MDYTRQVDIFNPEQFKDIKIGVIGVGSVGSFIVLTLAKMGLQNITVWDDDTVEEHNLPNQFYPISSINGTKVEALKSLITAMTGITIQTSNNKFGDTDLDATYGQDKFKNSIFISAVDSIETRREIWKEMKVRSPLLYIDTRMGGELMRIFTTKGQEDYTFYEKSLEREGVQLPCTARTIIYNVLANASIVALTIKKFLKKEPLAKEIIFDMKNMIIMNTHYTE